MTKQEQHSYCDLEIKCTTCGEVFIEHYDNSDDAYKETYATCPFCGRTWRLEK